MLVSVIDAILVAAILALLALQLGTTTVPALILGFVGFIATLGAFFWYAGRDVARAMAEYKPHFPTP